MELINYQQHRVKHSLQITSTIRPILRKKNETIRSPVVIIMIKNKNLHNILNTIQTINHTIIFYNSLIIYLEKNTLDESIKHNINNTMVMFNKNSEHNYLNRYILSSSSNSGDPLRANIPNGTFHQKFSRYVIKDIN